MEGKSTSQWAICPDCLPLWLAKDAAALARRAIKLLCDGGREPIGLKEELAVLYGVALLAIESGPTVMEVF